MNFYQTTKLTDEQMSALLKIEGERIKLREKKALEEKARKKEPPTIALFATLSPKGPFFTIISSAPQPLLLKDKIKLIQLTRAALRHLENQPERELF